ncbi:MAG: type II toxin-antitoxin system HipA family toxin [Alphaproteobacteria bacterium]|nr:type II toxin-antitoxin system HipA family toxin [Alphaproteobacteria bacterium]
MTIRVWTDGRGSGLLGPKGVRGTAFAYAAEAGPADAVSITMPVRLASWDSDFGLAPIFEMNLPEGALRERLRMAFAKATGSFDDLDLLAIVGRSQVGRLRYTDEHAVLDRTVPFQSVDELLASRRDGNLFQYLLERFAPYSGVSGVQPKLLIRDDEAWGGEAGAGEQTSIQGATHIVKFWENEYPQLAANEFLCLTAAGRCGLQVPRFRLSEDGRALVIDRFDLRADGRYRGFEDFCVLNGRRTADKYLGSYETAVLKRFREFASPGQIARGSETLFRMIALNAALRNGDAHLKNFGVVYDDVEGGIALAPVYDIVTTTAYIRADQMALTLDGSTRWPTARQLLAFGTTRQIGSPAVIKGILGEIAEGVNETMEQIRQHIRGHPEFEEVGKRMLVEWAEGIRTSLVE